jgi:hypothetical protein
MLVGFVSDEWDVAIAGAMVEVEHRDGVMSATSGPGGAIRADLPPGEATVTVAASGFGSKRLRATLADDAPLRVRLLSERPYGFMWPKWSPSGTGSEVRVHAPGGYDLSLWRYGWTRERVADLGRFDEHPPTALAQSLPDGDVAALGCDWSEPGAGGVPLDPRLHLVAPDEPGLYYLHVATHRGGHTSFPWVVSPRRPRHRVALLTSSLTWNSYNDFGGRSNYISPDHLPDRPTVAARQETTWYPSPELPAWRFPSYDPLSLERPEPVNEVPLDAAVTDPISVRGGEHVAPAEWRLVGWLEREGFDHDLYSDAQLADATMPLDAYDVLLLSTHPEYWTTDMFDRLERWVEAGGRLGYLGGNGINCPVVLDGPLMTVVNGDDFDMESSRMQKRYRTEVGLLGVQTTFSGYETGAPYRVLEPDHWVFAGLGLQAGDLFGTESLDCRAVGGASGHETDKRTPDTPTSAVLLAKGTNPDDGGAELLHLTVGDGEVFSVGSISYTCSIAVDPQVSRVTANVLTRWLA